MDSSPWISLAVIAPVDARSLAAEPTARVLRHELERRLGGVTVELRATGWEPVSIARSSWVDADGPWGSAPDVVVCAVDEPADAVSATPVVATTLCTQDRPHLAALFARSIDPLTLDVRRRMLGHLGVLPDGPYVLVDVDSFADPDACVAAAVEACDGVEAGPEPVIALLVGGDPDLGPRLVAELGGTSDVSVLAGFRPTPTDVFVLADGAVAVASADDGLCAMADADDDEISAVGAELDRVVAAVGELVAAMPAVAARMASRLSGLQHEVGRLRQELAEVEAARREERRLAVAWIEHATARERGLADRLERAELQCEVLAVDLEAAQAARR